MQTTQKPTIQRAPADDGAMKPIGFALAAVVAGLAPGGASPATTADVGPAGFDPEDRLVRPLGAPEAMDPRADEDPNLLLGPSEAVEPFAEALPAPQADLFDL